MSPSVDPNQRSVGAGTPVHGLGGKADRVDANRWARPRMKRAQLAGSEVGKLTVSVCCTNGMMPWRRATRAPHRTLAEP
jgi:hypothetical protein